MRRLFMALFLFAAVACAADSAQSLLDEIVAVYNAAPAVEAHFTQTNTWPDLDRSMTSHGVMYYNQEKLLLRYDEPEGHMLLALPESIQMWDPGANREIILDPGEIAGQLRPAQLVAHYADGALLERTDIGDRSELRITPEDSQDLRRLRVTWDRSKKRIVEMGYETIDGDQVSYLFTDQKFPSVIKEETFLPNLPSSRDIIDTRQ